jgi:hypothetical protein
MKDRDRDRDRELGDRETGRQGEKREVRSQKMDIGTATPPHEHEPVFMNAAAR